MADQFEFYTAKVPVEPTPVPAVPRVTITSILGRTLAQAGEAVIQKQIRVGKEIGLEKASQAGTMAGSQIGFVPKEAKTEEDIVFNRAAMQAQKATLQNEVRNTMMGFSDDELRNPNLNSINNYNARARSYSNTLLPTVAPALQPYTKNLVEYYGLTHKEPIVREVDALNRNIANSNLQLNYNNNLRDATNAAFKGDPEAAVALRMHVEKNLDIARNSGIIDSADYSNKILTLDRNIKFARYQGDFNKAIVAGTANKKLSEFITTQQKDLNPDEKRLLHNRLIEMLNQNKEALQAQYGNIENQIKDLNTEIFINGTNAATENKIATMKGIVDQYYVTDPDRAKELKDSMDFASERHAFRQSVLYIPEAQMRSKLAEKEQELKLNPTFDNAKDVEILRSDLKTVLQRRKTELYNIVSQHPAVIAATSAQRNSDQANVDAATGQKLGPATKSSIQDRDETMIQIEKGMGIDESDYEIIPSTDIQNLGSLFAAGDPEITTKALQAELLKHPNHKNEAMTQIQKHVKGINIMLLNGAIRPDTAPRRDMMFAAAKSTTQQVEAPLTDTQRKGVKDTVREDIMKNYGDAILNKNGDPNPTLDEAVDYCYKLALTYQLNGIGSPEKTAVNDALKAHVQIGTFNGRKYLIPNNANYGTKDVNNAIYALVQSINPKELRVPQYLWSGLDTKQRQENYLGYIQNHGYPALMYNNNGMLLLDEAREPVKLIDGSLKGQPIGFTFKELMDKSSSLHQKVHEIQAEEIARLKRLGVKIEHLIPGFLESL